MYLPSYLNERAVEDALWKTALETAGTLKIDPACASALRAWIRIGVQRMERQRRLAPEDLAIAHANLGKLIDIMKREAVFLGKAEQLDYPTFHAARRRLQRQATLTTFTLWPFWPHNFVATN